MSIQGMLRLGMMLVAAAFGWEIGALLTGWGPAARVGFGALYYRIGLATVAGLLGLLSAPYLTIKPYRSLRRNLGAVPARSLVVGLLGALVGLTLGALLALPLSLLPGALGGITPIVVALILAAIVATTTVMRERELLTMLGLFVGQEAVCRRREVVLLDTNAIIDGRVADICKAGFISGVVVVPRFVLDELQHIADSTDLLRRNRGRRGLDILASLRKDEGVELEVLELADADGTDVDGRLIAAALRLDCPIVTNDYNLSRVAALQGVRVLNVNALANAVRVAVLPGESLTVQVMQEGREAGQGVAYLDDGTMVVVEDGRRHMGQVVEITVTRVLQTAAGRMVFGQPQNGRR